MKPFEYSYPQVYRRGSENRVAIQLTSVSEERVAQFLGSELHICADHSGCFIAEIYDDYMHIKLNDFVIRSNSGEFFKLHEIAFHEFYQLVTADD